jgi:hypothetical protein
MATKRNTVYRVGDRVQVVDPQIVLRVGYPLGLADGRAYVVANHFKEAVELCRAVGGNVYRAYDLGFAYGERDPLSGCTPEFLRLIDSLAYAYVAGKGFGGADRSVHTKLHPELAGVTGVVAARKVAYSGRRRHGDQEEPPSFKARQAHVLLEVYLDTVVVTDANGRLSPTMWVEACRVARL